MDEQRDDQREQKRADLSRLALEDLDRAAGAAARARARWRIILLSLAVVGLTALAHLTRYRVVSDSGGNPVVWDRWRQQFCVVWNFEEWECYRPTTSRDRPPATTR